MTKIDKRCYKTKFMIKTAFFKLLKKKDINQITITQICDTAMIDRKTFYNHYIDYPDFIEKMRDEAIEQLYSQSVFIPDDADIETYIDFVLDILIKFENESHLLFNCGIPKESMQKKYSDLKNKPMLRKKIPPHLNDKEFELLSEYRISGLYNLTKTWWNNRDKYSRKDLKKILLSEIYIDS